MSDKIVTLEDDSDVLNVELDNYSVPVQADIIHTDTTEHWNAQALLIAERGQIYVYSDYQIVDDKYIPAIKIGDGTSYLIDLPFTAGDDTILTDHINDTVIHVTVEDKDKLNSIEAGAEVNVQSDWNQSDIIADDYIKNKPSIPTKTSDLVNDSDFITRGEAPVQGVKGSVESVYRTGNVSISKENIGLDKVDNTADIDKPVSTATQTALNAKQNRLTAGENITIQGDVISATGRGGDITVDSALSTTSTNPVQNKVITSALNAKANTSSLANVATSGSYNDLSNKPTIPTVPTNVSAFTNDAGYITSVPSEYVTETELSTAIAGKANTADLATVATSGSYEDLTNKPTIPTVPTNVSAFTNDAHYITASGAPVQSVNGQTGAVTVPDTDTTYTLSMAGNVITLTPSSGTASSITLPVYSGGVSA